MSRYSSDLTSPSRWRARVIVAARSAARTAFSRNGAPVERTGVVAQCRFRFLQRVKDRPVKRSERDIGIGLCRIDARAHRLAIRKSPVNQRADEEVERAARQ